MAKKQVVPEVPKQIFERYLAKLVEEKLPLEVVERLRHALIDDGDFSEAAVRTALFGPDAKK